MRKKLIVLALAVPLAGVAFSAIGYATSRPSSNQLEDALRSFGYLPLRLPSSEMTVLGRAAVRRAFPSFSVIEIMPVSAIAKFAPVIPMSAVIYFWRSTRRAIMVSSSGFCVGALPSSRVKSSLISPRVRCMAGKTM